MISTTKAKAVLGATVLLALAAGTGLGMLFVQVRQNQTAAASQPQSPPKQSWLADRLGLTAEQQKQMDDIWRTTRASRHEREDARHAATSQRDQDMDEFLKTLSPAKQNDFDKIHKDYAARLAELADQDRKAYDSAVESTRKILTPEQADKYEELMKNPHRRGMGGPGGFGGPNGPGGPHPFHHGPTSRPGEDRAGRPGTAPPTSGLP